MNTNIEKREHGLYIDPTTDFGFKYLFKRKEIMKPFLEDVLGFGIKDIDYLNNEEHGENKEDKGIIYDLLCTAGDGSEFIVEMQRAEQVCFSDRIIYYLSKRIVSNFHKGDNVGWRYGIKPLYGIFLLDFHLRDLKPASVRKIMFEVEGTGEVFNKNVIAYTLELPGYRKMKETECKTKTDEWLYNIANMENMKGELSFKCDQEAFARLEELGKKANLTPAEEAEYERRLKVHWDNLAVYEFQFLQGRADGMEAGLAEGRAKGLAEGLAEGRTEGRTEGRAEGRAEGILSVARNMKVAGADVSFISQTTGLSKEEIEKI